MTHSGTPDPRRHRDQVNRRTKQVLRVVCAGVTVLALLLGFVWVRRYTKLGIFILHGSNYWVARARDTHDPEQAKQYLRRVLAATQYGVNSAENSVTELDNEQDRARLFRLLADIAPNRTWREIYMERAGAEAGKTVARP